MKRITFDCILARSRAGSRFYVDANGNRYTVHLVPDAAPTVERRWNNARAALVKARRWKRAVIAAAKQEGLV
jgi:hypothetical protein